MFDLFKFFFFWCFWITLFLWWSL